MKGFFYFYIMLPKHNFIINGAGPVGLSVALLLMKNKHLVNIYEKRSDPRLHYESGRSINLALSDRGFRTLGLLGLDETIKKRFAIAMRGRMIHDENGNLQLQPYSVDNKCIYSVSRNILNNILLDEAEKNGLQINFKNQCIEYNLEKEELQLEKGIVSTKGKTVIACDGAFSPIRNSLKNDSNFQHQETKLNYAYKEFTIPSGVNGSWQMEKHALHIWPRKSFMLIALPNTDGSFTCTLFLRKSVAYAQSLDASFENIASVENARYFFEKHFSDATKLMSDFEENFAKNPVSELYMETCSPWNLKDKLLLLGVAAHAIVPFYGQGLNAGLEDVRILIEFMNNNSSLSEQLNLFQRKRKIDTDAIAELALQNFIEMRDLVTDELFLTKRKLESKLKKMYAEKWNTQYELVTFSSLPYSKAHKIGVENDKKLNLILEDKILTKHLLEDEITEQDYYLLSSIVL